MTPELSNKLIQIAEKLGTTADNIVATAKKQVKIDYAMTLVRLLIFLLLAIPVYYLWVYILPQCKPENPAGQYSFERQWPSDVIFKFMGIAIASVICFVGIVINGYSAIEDGITLKYNPESLVIDRVSNLL